MPSRERLTKMINSECSMIYVIFGGILMMVRDSIHGPMLVTMFYLLLD